MRPLFLECSSFFLRGYGTSSASTRTGKPTLLEMARLKMPVSRNQQTLAIKEQRDTGDEEQDENKDCAIKERLDNADTMDTDGTDERQDENDDDDEDEDYETDDDTTHQEVATALSRFLMITSCYEDVPNNETMNTMISSFELGSRNYTTEEEEDYGSEDERNDDEQLDVTSTSSTQEKHDVEDEQLDTTCTTTTDVHDRNAATENVACEEEDGNADTDDDAGDDDTNATEATAENEHDKNDQKDNNQDPEEDARCSKKDAPESIPVLLLPAAVVVPVPSKSDDDDHTVDEDWQTKSEGTKDDTTTTTDKGTNQQTEKDDDDDEEEDREPAMIRTEEQQNRQIIMDSTEQAEDEESEPHYPDAVQMIPIESVGRKEERDDEVKEEHDAGFDNGVPIDLFECKFFATSWTI